jgi:hypothetical protein
MASLQDTDDRYFSIPSVMECGSEKAVSITNITILLSHSYVQ